MSTFTPATITFYANNRPHVLRFHTVITESHESNSEITKYPIQSGFVITNHAIRKNRKIHIEGIVSNTLLANHRTSYNYGTQSAKTVFKAIQELVSSSIECTVTTNLGIYYPVIFNKFSVVQQQTTIDCIHFNLYGEELQVRTALNKTGPNEAVFKKVADSEYQSRLDALNALGLSVSEGALISETTVNLGESFVFKERNEAGEIFNVTYIYRGNDPTTGNYQYEQHSSDTNSVGSSGGSVGVQSIGIQSVSKLIDTNKFSSVTSSCLKSGLDDIISGAASDIVEDFLDATVGRALKTIYGFLNQTITLGTEGDSIGGAIINMGIDCVVQGVKESSKVKPPDLREEAAKYATDASEYVRGAKDQGLNSLFGENPNRATTFTRVSDTTLGIPGSYGVQT